MDYRSLTSLALRLAGVFILVNGIAALPNTFVQLFIFGARETATPVLAPALFGVVFAAIVPLAIGLLLIYFPSVIANRVVKTEAVGSEGSVAYRDLQSLALCVLGVYFISVGLYDAIYWFARTRIYYRVIEGAAGMFPNAPALMPDDFAGFVYAAVHILGGLILFLGARGVSRLAQRLRGVGDAER